MNPLLLSAAFGFAKGLAEAPGRRPARFNARTHLVAPVLEEAMFRAAPALAGAPAQFAVAAFAADHLFHELPQHTPASAAWRLAETVAGGLLYQRAYDRFGFFGAVAAHCLHNVAVSAGRAARAPVPRARRGRR